MLEAPDLGNEDAGMPKEQSAGKPTTRRYSPEEKAAAVRMVRALRSELGTTQGAVQRVANQLGYGVESVRTWVRQTDIDERRLPPCVHRPLTRWSPGEKRASRDGHRTPPGR